MPQLEISCPILVKLANLVSEISETSTARRCPCSTASPRMPLGLPTTYQSCLGRGLAGNFEDLTSDILQEPNDKSGKPKPVLSTEYITRLSKFNLAPRQQKEEDN